MTTESDEGFCYHGGFEFSASRRRVATRRGGYKWGGCLGTSKSGNFKAKITHRSRKDTECMGSRSAVEEEVKLPRAINHIQSDVVTEIGGGAAQKYLFNPFFLHSYFIRSALFSLGDVAKHFSGVNALVNPGEQRLHT